MTTTENLTQVEPLSTYLVETMLSTKDNYPNLSKQFEALEDYYNTYNKFMKRVADIDQKVGIINQALIITLQLRSNEFETDISNYLKELDGISPWNLEMLEIVGEIWKLLYENEDIDDFEEFIMLLKNNDHDWIYTCNAEKCPYEYLIPLLQKWKEVSPRINYFPIFKLFEKLVKYKTADAIVLTMLEDRKELVELINFDIQHIHRYMRGIDNDIATLYSVNENNLLLAFPEYEFIKLYNDPLSVSCLTNMHKAILSIPGAQDYVKNIEEVDATNFYIEQITAHPSVDENGHSGNSFCWTIYTLKRLYNSDWKTFVKEVLKARGIMQA